MNGLICTKVENKGAEQSDERFGTSLNCFQNGELVESLFYILPVGE